MRKGSPRTSCWFFPFFVLFLYHIVYNNSVNREIVWVLQYHETQAVCITYSAKQTSSAKRMESSCVTRRVLVQSDRAHRHWAQVYACAVLSAECHLLPAHTRRQFVSHLIPHSKPVGQAPSHYASNPNQPSTALTAPTSIQVQSIRIPSFLAPPGTLYERSASLPPVPSAPSSKCDR